MDNNVPRHVDHMFLLYCPPTSNIAAVRCPSEKYLYASISTVQALLALWTR